MTTSFINLNGTEVDAASVTLPPTGRAFRDAWVLNGTVIEVDMEKAKDIHIDKLLREVALEQELAVSEQRKADAKGDTVTGTKAAQRLAKLNGKPAAAAVNAVKNAKVVADLTAVTLADMYK